MLPLTHVCAQEVSFQTFLSEFEKSECIDSVSFGKPFDFIDRTILQVFASGKRRMSLCTGNIRWQKGRYVEYKNFITITLQRYCSDYQDGNSQWFMENDGTDYVLITYS